MPRKKRIHAPGALHHVMSRGIEGRDLFTDDEDREIFLGIFAREITKTGFLCYAWVLMDNHYHVVIRTNEKQLSSLFKPLNATYARYYGKKYKRRGYLFGDRFKSIATQDQGYLEELIRYVHLNPFRAGICESMDELDSYRWCGHGVLIGKTSVSFQTVEPVLKRFGDSQESAIIKYREFIANGLNNSGKNELIEQLRSSAQNTENIHNPGCWVIGDIEFVKQSLACDTDDRLRLAKYQKLGVDLKSLCERVETHLELGQGELLHRGRKNSRSEGRKIFAYIGHRQFGFSVADIARYLHVSGPAVSKVLHEGEILTKTKNFR